MIYLSKRTSIDSIQIALLYLNNKEAYQETTIVEQVDVFTEHTCLSRLAFAHIHRYTCALIPDASSLISNNRDEWSL